MHRRLESYFPHAKPALNNQPFQVESDEEDNWSPYPSHCNPNQQSSIPFLASDDEELDMAAWSSDEDSACGSISEEIVQRVKIFGGDVDDLPYCPKRGSDYATTKKRIQARKNLKNTGTREPRGPYSKGPSIADKARRTQQAYAAKEHKEGMKQTTLTGFVKLSNTTTAIELTGPTPPPLHSPAPNLVESDHIVENLEDASNSSNNRIECSMKHELQKRKHAPHVLDLPLPTPDESSPPLGKRRSCYDITVPPNLMSVMNNATRSKSWQELREGIDKILDANKKKKGRELSLSQLNQYQLLRSFATLRIKGYKRIPGSIHIATDCHDGDGSYFASRIRMLARYYEKHESLPIER
ncbi:uncharacterized protein EI90DRAFT_3116325 [Cantharellus anzutake]|uniref:uncharacterized protein n=1 Tax=Cantharellus anzutake TaxID=1750568 RepID=UPI0019039769|nr:uncharacterized protein EI90DRAFT_3116325 [Cantharellus anzutake]KAF8341197.1 hypothetical protein EI90DRAFT_3116325 [Cantharellus anzutake]